MWEYNILPIRFLKFAADKVVKVLSEIHAEVNQSHRYRLES